MGTATQDVDQMLSEINALSAQAELLALNVALEAARAAGEADTTGDCPAEMAVLLEKMRQQAAAVDRMARRLSALANAPGAEPVQLGGGAALRDAAQELQRSLQPRKPARRVPPSHRSRHTAARE